MLGLALLTIEYTYFNSQSQAIWFIMLVLVGLFLIKLNSLVNAIIILEFLILNALIFVTNERSLTMTNYWNIFRILVFSAIEARVGLALLVHLARIWGSVIKLASFN